MYSLLKPLLFAQDAERIHETTGEFGRLAGKFWLVRSLTSALYNYQNPALEQTVFGMQFRNPVGTAAGFDKPGRLVDILHAAGIGFVETGTVTPRSQSGNPKPRLFRLPADEAVINRMGFNNHGLKPFTKQLATRKTNAIVGGNIGKNKDTDRAIDDYVACYEAIVDLVDYLAVNVSSPNTPGLRDLQGKGPLTEILLALQKVNDKREQPKPILLKIAPDLTDGQLDDIVEVARATKIAGIIATNTTISRDNLKTPATDVEQMGNGGLSGQPLTARSAEVISHLYSQLQGEVPIIGVGGIASAEQAYAKIRAGANLIQVYTGLVYKGPVLIKQINSGLVRLLQQDGFSNISEAVGAEHR